MTKVIVALDFPSESEALSMVDLLKPDVGLFKVGLELFVASGPSVVRAVRERDAGVFLDLKLNDIPNTVKGAAACATRLDVDIISVHAGIGREGLVAARQGVEEAAGVGKRPVLAAVTVLTSLGGEEAGGEGGAGTAGAVLERVLRLSRLAVECGLDGIITSVREAAEVRRAVGPGPSIITPGIRLSDSVQDHKRAGTVADAVAAGVDFLVVGRPITRAPDPRAQARRFIEEIARSGGKPEK
ncbi:MAG: orotidine-5'-phosphate decarboxylase [Candidatus Eisenbacteria bacterium]|nr:orotidine-5'-phosphate decarboxylase [Candidatus Eisenbacteria bacterium]